MMKVFDLSIHVLRGESDIVRHILLKGYRLCNRFTIFRQSMSTLKTSTVVMFVLLWRFAVT